MITLHPVRVLVVEDYEPFRPVICSTLRERAELEVTCEVSDGLEAVRKAEELQPDLIVLDIGLPKLNGVEAARRIREAAPKSKILFVSQESSVDVVEAAFSLGASAYVVKMDAACELPDAVKLCFGERDLSGADLRVTVSPDLSDARTPAPARGNSASAPLPQH